MIFTGTGIPANRLILTGTGISPGSRSILAHVIARHDDEVFDIEWNYYTHAVEVNITYWENSDNLQYG